MSNTNWTAFDTALATFIADCQRKINENYAKNLPNLKPDTLVDEYGKKRVRIVCQGPGQRSAWAFIDKATGDILKPASWAAPAKHARGNIYQPETWTTVTAYGPAYLK